MKVVRSSPLRTGRLYLQEYPGTHFLEAEPTPGTSPVTRAGIDPGTFWLVAQRLNHYATPAEHLYFERKCIYPIEKFSILYENPVHKTAARV